MKKAIVKRTGLFSAYYNHDHGKKNSDSNSTDTETGSVSPPIYRRQSDVSVELWRYEPPKGSAQHMKIEHMPGASWMKSLGLSFQEGLQLSSTHTKADFPTTQEKTN
jgi:hypothetical protein